MSLLNCFLKQAQLKIPEICFYKDGGLALPLVVCGVCGCCSASHKLLTWHLHLLAGLGEGSACGWGAVSRGSRAKQTTGKRKHVFPAWDRAGAHLHCFQTLCSLFPSGHFSLHKQSNHFFKNSAATQKRNISSYGKALGGARKDLVSRVL